MGINEERADILRAKAAVARKTPIRPDMTKASNGDLLLHLRDIVTYMKDHEGALSGRPGNEARSRMLNTGIATGEEIMRRMRARMETKP